MLFQLPSGKVIHLSIEQYLDLSDDEVQDLLQDLIAQNAGDYIKNPFYKSAISKQRKRDIEESEDDVEEESMDYSPDQEEVSSEKPIINLETSIEDFPDISEEEDFIL